MIIDGFYKRLITDVVYADGAAAAPIQQPGFLEQLFPLLVIGMVMYFLIIRPQAKKAKDHMAMIKSLKPGDEVVTSGGLIGRVRSVSDKIVQLDLGSTTIKVVKENIAQASSDLVTSTHNK